MSILNNNARWTVVKRSGLKESFDACKVTNAVRRCHLNGLNATPAEADRVSNDVLSKVINIISQDNKKSIGVEDLQRLIIQQLWAGGHFAAAEHYQNYREKHRQLRVNSESVPESVINQINSDVAHFGNDLRYYQFVSKYARWKEDVGRRETWSEACERVMNFMKSRPQLKCIDDEIWEELHKGLYNHEATCALRLLQMAGPALERCNLGAFNCTAMDIDCLEAFSELLYVLMQGCGAGFSVESECIDKLPRVRKQQKHCNIPTFVIEDSTEGWCDALLFGLKKWFGGEDANYDYSKIRPAGAKLKTKGGRASGPEPLKSLLVFTRQKVMSRSNGRLTDLDCHDICCMMGKIVQVGGVRRAAEISISDLDSEEMRFAKHGVWWEKAPMRDMANNSAVYNEKPDAISFMREWLSLAESGSGERGIFNRYAANHSIPKRRKKWRFLPNPCLVGDTLVCVADGREAVSIKQLADEGKDVLVYCGSDSSNLTVRWMRNPRLTGVNQPIYKVVLDDGLSIRVTGNHKFLRRNGEYVETLDLKQGDSLSVMTRYTPESCKEKSRSRGDRYKFLQWKMDGSCYEHRLIASYNVGREILKTEHVHHIDGNRLNNSPDNISVLGMREHLKNHSFGITNGNSTGHTNSYLLDMGRQLARSLGRRFSTEEWDEFASKNGLPGKFSSWRKQSLGDCPTFSKKCAILEGFADNVDLDPRVTRSYIELVNSGIDAEIMGGKVFINKICETCKQGFAVPKSRREVSFCSVRCSNKSGGIYYINSRKMIVDSIKKTYSIKKSVVREKQLEVYTEIKNKFGKDPMKEEWVKACKENGISPEISRVSSPFRSWSQLKEAASSFNHRVVSVEFDGYEDVYNGTVDDFHNFFVGGWEIDKTEKGRRRQLWLNNKNCGEINLRSDQGCNLSITVARSGDTKETLRRKVRLAAIWGTLQSTLTDFKYVREIWKINFEEERLLGVDITGQQDCELLRFGAPGRASLLDELKQLVLDVNAEFAGKLDIPISAATTCVKPSGNSAQLFQCSSGVHTRYAKYQIRRFRAGLPTLDTLTKFIVDQGVPCHIDPLNSSLVALDFLPDPAPEGTPCRDDLTALQQLEYWLETKEHWAEHSVSCTIYVGPNEWIDVGQWVYHHFDQINSISFLPKDGGTYSLLPNEEVSEETYKELKSKFPKIDWSKLASYESEDNTTLANEVACTSGSCEL